LGHSSGRLDVMRTAAIVVMALLCAASVATAAPKEVPDLTSARMPASASGLQILGRRIATEGCSDASAMPEDVLELAGNRAPSGFESGRRASLTDRRCELECPTCHTIENEPYCEDNWEDVWNGGCNSSPYVFQTVQPYYGRITICGTAGTYDYYGSTYRDTDWYEIVLDEATTITFSCVAEFPLQILVIDGTNDCPGSYIMESAFGDSCVEASIVTTIGPGTFWLWVGPNVYTGVPCDSDYIMTLDGYYATDCVMDCPGGSLMEEEPPCEPEYYDSHNGGCNSDPPVFQYLEPSVNTIYLCGEAGVYPYQGSCYRDTDWYEMVLDQPREIEFCCAAEFPLQILMVQPGATPCVDDVVLDFAQVDACELACLTLPLDPGTYWLWVGPSVWYPIDCGRRYTMIVNGYTTAVERKSWGTIKHLYR
jgi:hypothetical protein